MKYPARKKSGQSVQPKAGQSLVEFVLALFAFFTIVFMYVQIALGFGIANFTQYATFMSARAYLAGWEKTNEQKSAAQAYLNETVTGGGDGRWKTIAKAVDGDEPVGATIGGSSRIVGEGSPQARLNNWEQGVTYKFRIKMYLLPLIKSRSPGGAFINLESQSLLGREPTYDECFKYMNTTKGPQISKRPDIKNGFLVDNGC